MNRLTTWDVEISGRIGLALENRHYKLAARLAHLGDGSLVFVILAALYGLGWLGNLAPLRQAVIFAVAGIVVAAVVITGIKYLLKRQRPRDPTGFVTISYDKYSFPSGHSGRMSALATGIYFVYPVAGLLLGGLAIIVALARVAVRVHYLLDVLVGLALGGLVTWGVHQLLIGLPGGLIP